MIPIEDLSLHTLVLITWVDSNYTLGWHQSTELTARLPTATTVGFVTCSTDRLLELSGSLGEDGGKLNPLSVPWVSITELEILSAQVTPASPAPDSAANNPLRERFLPEPQDLPETVENDASFNFRKLQLELGHIH